MDSVETALLESAADTGATIERHARDKDATDLELALDAAIARGAVRIVVVGGGGGRLDHLLANAALLADERYSRVTVEWFVDDYLVAVVRGSFSIAGAADDVVTLLAVGGPVTVTATGLRWPLDAEELTPGSTRGVSNRLTADEAAISVDSGTVLVLHRRAR